MGEDIIGLIAIVVIIGLVAVIAVSSVLKEKKYSGI